MRKGFTLVELLIALAILGVIAMFVLPKILTTIRQDINDNAIAKEAAGMMSNALIMARSQGTLTDSTSVWDLTPYLNYVKVETGLMDDNYGTTASQDCTAKKCLRLHNGAVLITDTTPFTSDDRMVWFDIDPDGQYDGTASGPGKTVTFWLYYNGKLRTWGTIDSGSTPGSGGSLNPDPSKDPPWFSWD